MCFVLVLVQGRFGVGFMRALVALEPPRLVMLLLLMLVSVAPGAVGFLAHWAPEIHNTR